MADMMTAGKEAGVVRMKGEKLNNLKPVGPAIKQGTYDPNLTYVVVLDAQGVPQEAKPAGPGYQEGGPVETEEPGEAMEAPEGEDMEKTGAFDSYVEAGVKQDLVDRGNDLANRIQEIAGSSDPSAKEQFLQEAKDFVSSVEATREEAMQAGDPELMRALKEMLGDARDLVVSIENILAEAENSADYENRPDQVIGPEAMNTEEVVV